MATKHDQKITEKTSYTVIEPRKGWQLINLRELYEYKDLLYFMVKRDILVVYKQSVFGFCWAIVRPVMSMVIFSIIFGKLAKISSDGIPYPIFTYTALLPWQYFSQSMTQSTQSLVSKASIITKVYFPRIIIPIAPVFAGLADFVTASSVLSLLMIWYSITPTINILFIPLLILLMIFTAAGIGMWLSAITIQFRDLKHAVSYLSQVLMYAAPVVWPASLIPEKFRLVYGIYPMAGVIEGFRSALLGKKPMPWDLIFVGTIVSFLLVVSGAYYFRRMEKIFADVA